ncbi:tyrosine-type recombinase/integrase [Pseudomonas mosselii]|uniref:tyrosine-type recombinase/integrase n=1 Tax=Pseudomonas mosselii TaxID=78327 RepID=UPI001EE372E6|nr:site-specific integrase [Pseudomonas mosselii]
MVAASVPRTVRPIALESISKLVTACDALGKTRFKRCRDRCIVVLLADSGIRREELTWIRCENIKLAALNGNSLRVRTSKRRGNPEREIPLPSETVSMLLEFLDVHRALRMKRLEKKVPSFVDEGWLFCTVSGAKMSPASVSQLFGKLRKLSQTQGRASPHMLRHRYITLQIVSRIRAMRRQNIGLEALTTILSRVASLSGHGSLQSLWAYVDWAFDELDPSDTDSKTNIISALALVEELLDESYKAGNCRLAEGLKQLKIALREDQQVSVSATALSHSFSKNNNR